MFLRLAQAEIGCQRQGGDQFGEPHPRRLVIDIHEGKGRAGAAASPARHFALTRLPSKSCSGRLTLLTMPGIGVDADDVAVRSG
jgi:hypothetical protein